MDRAAVLEDAKHTIPRWRANPDLLRKHYLLSEDGYGGGVYIWPSKAVAQKGHDAAWRDSVRRRTGAEPVIRYFDLLMAVGNENDIVTEWTESGEARPVGRQRFFDRMILSEKSATFRDHALSGARPISRRLGARRAVPSASRPANDPARRRRHRAPRPRGRGPGARAAHPRRFLARGRRRC